MLNRCMIIGNLGDDPTMRYTANGSAVTNFNVATSRSYTKNEERVEEVEWFSVVCWNRLAETCAQYLAKGRQVYVEGRMQTRSWEGSDGKKRYKTELIADEVKFLGQAPEPYVSVATEGDTSYEDIDQDDLPF